MYAVFTGEQGDYASADTLINQSQDIAHELGDQTGVAVSLNALEVFARDRGDVAVAQVLKQHLGCGGNWEIRRLSPGPSVTWPTSLNCKVTMRGRAPCTLSVCDLSGTR